eukprot:jgi/Psemu1/1915/gm1.1915_g
MNHAQELYLRTYRKLDQIDSSISRANIGYKSWKYYHSVINHSKALSIATAYDIYKELTDGTHGPTWSIEKPMDYQVYTQLIFCFVRILICQCTNAPELTGGDVAATPLIMGTGTFCFSSIEMGRHLGSFKSTKWHSVRLCYACGKACYYMCSKCKDGKFNIALCSVKVGNRCFQQYHNHRFFGLLKGDEYMEYLVFGKKKKKKQGEEVECPEEQSSISVTEFTADLISAVAAM